MSKGDNRSQLQSWQDRLQKSPPTASWSEADRQGLKLLVNYLKSSAGWADGKATNKPMPGTDQDRANVEEIEENLEEFDNFLYETVAVINKYRGNIWSKKVAILNSILALPEITNAQAKARAYQMIFIYKDPLQSLSPRKLSEFSEIHVEMRRQLRALASRLYEAAQLMAR